MTNHFISGVRSRREYNDLDEMPEVGIPATRHDRTELRELNALGSTRNPTELNMTEVIRAVFAAVSTADAAVHDLQVARIPSATISRTNARAASRTVGAPR